MTIAADAGYTGPDSVTLRADDGRVQGTATVVLDVIAHDANTAPSCAQDFFGGPSPVRDQVSWVRTIACQVSG